MDITHIFGGPRRRAIAPLMGILCVAVALSMSVTAPAANAAGIPPQFHDHKYNDDTDGFMCPVETDATGAIKQVYGPGGRYTKTLEVTTAITIGYNGYIFAACRAYVFVDVVAKTGNTMATFQYEPWAGGLSTNIENHVEQIDFSNEDLDNVAGLRIRQYPRYT